jgi:hypothetical protein
MEKSDVFSATSRIPRHLREACFWTAKQSAEATATGMGVACRYLLFADYRPKLSPPWAAVKLEHRSMCNHLSVLLRLCVFFRHDYDATRVIFLPFAE